MLQEQKSPSSIAAAERPFQMTDADVIDIFSAFHPLGHWRHDLATGHTYCCATLLNFFGLPQSEGPVSMVDLSARLHPDDLSLVMEAHESASVEPMHYQKIHRIRQQNDTYRWYCSTGSFRPRDGTLGEIVGITWEIPPHRCETMTKRMAKT